MLCCQWLSNCISPFYVLTSKMHQVLFLMLFKTSVSKIHKSKAHSNLHDIYWNSTLEWYLYRINFLLYNNNVPWTDVWLTWKAAFFLIASQLWHLTNTIESGSLEYNCQSNMNSSSLLGLQPTMFYLFVPLHLIKGDTLDVITLFHIFLLTTSKGFTTLL